MQQKNLGKEEFFSKRNYFDLEIPNPVQLERLH
jgi:hypothetical protein